MRVASAFHLKPVEAKVLGACLGLPPMRTRSRATHSPCQTTLRRECEEPMTRALPIVAALAAAGAVVITNGSAAGTPLSLRLDNTLQRFAHAHPAFPGVA